jgi:putative phage-type endonuclease
MRAEKARARPAAREREIPIAARKLQGGRAVMATCGQREGEAWLEARRALVTGTDVAKILCLDPYCSRAQLVKEKVLGDAFEKRADKRSDYFKQMGQAQEPWAALSFQTWLRAGHNSSKLETGTLVTDPVYTWLGGTPDALLGDDVVVEYKTRCFPTCLCATPIDKVPPTYYLQVQTYLQVCNRNKGILYCWTWENGATVWRILRDENLFDVMLVPKLLAFHEHVSGTKKCYEAGEFGDQKTFENTVSRIFRAQRGEKDFNWQMVDASMQGSLSQIHDADEI